MLVEGGYISNLLVESAGSMWRGLAHTRDTRRAGEAALRGRRSRLKQGVAAPQALGIDTTDTIVTASAIINFVLKRSI
ncbi:MAG: hypothetical protein V7640_3836 [Betaproteobacteria bacterium]|jgi:hypothetical protein